MEKMGIKKFAAETDKKIRWVLNMYHDWRIARNKCPNLICIWADLDDISTLEKNTLSYGLCCFITEIKKLSGDDFPAKTLYEMIICVQMYLEKMGIFWKLLDDSDPAFV